MKAMNTLSRMKRREMGKLSLPKSYYDAIDEVEAHEAARATEEERKAERLIVIEQAKEIAVAIGKSVYVIDCGGAPSEWPISGVLYYAIRLDHDPYRRSEAVRPDGTICECEEYT